MIIFDPRSLCIMNLAPKRVKNKFTARLEIRPLKCETNYQIDSFWISPLSHWNFQNLGGFFVCHRPLMASAWGYIYKYAGFSLLCVLCICTPELHHGYTCLLVSHMILTQAQSSCFSKLARNSTSVKQEKASHQQIKNTFFLENVNF